MKLLQKILPTLPFIFVFLYSLYIPIDPDLGWHLKNGEHFFRNGAIIRENTYSTMMSGYLWSNTSWLTDVLTYAIYAVGGLFALTIAGSVIVTLTFYFFSKIARLQPWDQVFLFPLILYLLQPVNSVSFRGQQITLLFTGILFYFLSLYEKKPKSIYFVIPLFFLWANLHGQFILGLALLALWMLLYALQKITYIQIDTKQKKRQTVKKRFNDAFRTVQMAIDANKKEFRTFGIILLCSALSTLLNPFGWGIHQAALSHINSPLLQNISEYLPFEMLSTGWWNQVIAGVLIVFGFLALFFRNKVMNNIPLLGVGLTMFLLSFEVRRYAWPAYYLILPLLTPLSTYLKPDNKKVTQILAIVFAIVLISMAIIAKLPLTQFIGANWQTYCNEVKCPPKAVEYMIENNLTQNPYTLYGWGGYLIWNYPQVKPSIDGRMHLWSQDGYSAFEEYFAYEQNFKDIDTSKYNVVLISPEKPVHERLMKLENAGKWKMVYNDKNASVFVRK